jgi:UDP-N-acetylglucosamine 4,6-dehydratase
MNWQQSTVLLTGGTGSFGKKFIEVMIRDYCPKKLIVFSRDELKQHEMSTGGFNHASIRYFLGDVRDRDRLRRAMNGVDLVVHAAALKQVPACEYNPIEAVLTNIIGARNVIEAALDTGVARVLALSTDKAVNPVNLYGATKLVAEKLFTQANAYSGTGPTHFSCVRYGNVLGSRGSVIPLFQKQLKTGVLTVTDERMTRFWLSLDEGVSFVVRAIERMNGGEVFVPKIPSMKIMELAKVMGADCEIRVTGIRPGEKVHETLVSEDEARHTVELDDMYVIRPEHSWWSDENFIEGRALPDGFHYSSDMNSEWMSGDELLLTIGEQIELTEPASYS